MGGSYPLCRGVVGVFYSPSRLDKIKARYELHKNATSYIEQALRVLYSYLHVHSASQRHNIKDRRMKEGRRKKTSLEKYSPLTLLQGFEKLACERMLETERKLHILTPLLWPSRCVLFWCWGPLHRGFSEGPLGRMWPSLPHLVSNSLGVCWQLHRGFPRSPAVGCGLPYHISSLLSGIRLATALGPKLNWVK